MIYPDAIARAFQAAIDLARDFEGATSPNPQVGCVLLDSEGNTLAAAAHEGSGLPHAEAMAIRKAISFGVADKVHTAIVTLEPCNHHGRTGPCSEALLSLPLKALWYGVADPNPTAKGGASRLLEAGVEVKSLRELDHVNARDLLNQVVRLLAPFAIRVVTGRPFVTVKQALDAQGNMIPPPGQKTFTSRSSLELAHRLRRRSDAIVTGSGTILADRPEFTVRHVQDITGKRRILCILDRRGRVDAAYLDSAHARGFDTMVATDPVAALVDLADRGCNEALLEAGPELTGHFKDHDLWDEWVEIRKGSPDLVSIRHRPTHANE
jgi:diaminohydroxyphosphoribosylaminopyrimidine deaminase/5-amino-6-(5-phosphoribosylamino)uracil reductase